MPAVKKRTVKRKTSTKYEGGKVRKVHKAKTAKTTKTRTARVSKPKTKSLKVAKKTKGKSRGASEAGKVIKKFLDKMYAEAKAKGRKPTPTERSKAFKEGWAEFKKKMK